MHFDSVVLSKAHEDLDKKKIQKSDVSWHWRVVQSLKKKITLCSRNDIRNLLDFQPTTQKSHSFTLMGYFGPKYMGVELIKNTEESSFMTLNSDSKFE